MLIKNPLMLIKLMAILLTFNQANLLSEEKILQMLNEIYFQPYPEFSRQALYYRFPDFDKWQRPDAPIKNRTSNRPYDG